MLDLPWNIFRTFDNPATLEPLIEWAESTVGTTRIEVSMNDNRIWNELPREEWLGVCLAPMNNAKMDSSPTALTFLFGLGAPSEPAGNLIYIRIHADFAFIAQNKSNPAAQHFGRGIKSAMLLMKQLSIEPDSNMRDYFRSN